MGNLTELSILCIFLTFLSANTLPDHPKLHHHSRNKPQKCDLICPGQHPLPLPPNFIQNSTCVNSTTSTTSTTRRSTTAKTTTESSSEEESTEEESSERNMKHRHIKNKHFKNSHQQRKLKKKVRKETVLLKRQGKSHIFKHNKALREKARLDGCYVICSDNNAVTVTESPDTSEPASDSEESGDNYVAGEDTPIEIIYVPGDTNRSPSDVYQINNYEMIEPDPFPGFGYEPWFRQSKHKKVKKNKKQHTKRKHNNGQRKA